uniref:CSON014391 protein n=1 Tax=Culicoides sonorensis TaxID=179676 RepID=A0A336MD92_CULSO
MFSFIITILLSLISLSVTQFNQYAHKDVIDNARNEALLPPYLKSQHYRVPRIRAALAYNSWFGPGEKPVFERAAHNISRKEIYTVLAHAGLIPRNSKYFRF